MGAPLPQLFAFAAVHQHLTEVVHNKDFVLADGSADKEPSARAELAQLLATGAHHADTASDCRGHQLVRTKRESVHAALKLANAAAIADANHGDAVITA